MSNNQAHAETLKKTNKKKDKTAPLRAFLQEKPTDELVDLLINLIEKDKKEWHNWQLKLNLSQTNQSLGEIKKLITKALPAKEINEWRKAQHYFKQADTLFETIFQTISNLPMDDQWKLVQHALTRLNKVLERIDDANDDRESLETTLCKKLVQLFDQRSWSDAEKAQWLFEQIANQNLDLLPNIPNDFNPSEATLEQLREKCAQQLEKMPSNKPYKKDDLFNYHWQLKHYCQPLIDHAIATDDWRKHCSLLGVMAYDSRDLLHACQICLDHDEPFDAEDWLIKAKKCSTDDHDKLACARMEVEVQIALDQPKDAWKTAWARFEQSPSFTGFKDLQTLEERMGIQDNTLIEKTEQLLLQACQQSTHSYIGFVSPVILDDILALYLHQKQFDKALAWTKQHKSSPHHQIELANAIIKQHPEESAELYRQIIFTLIEQSKDESYQKAITLLLALEKHLKQENISLSPLSKILQTISQKYRHKRKMMALIREQLAQHA